MRPRAADPFLCLSMLALSCSQPAPESAVFIRNATVIDGTGGAPQPGIDLVIRGSDIEAMGPDLAPPAGATEIDASGKYVLPGLIDTHVHLDAPMVFQLENDERERVLENTGRAFLFNGVTTVLNLSSDAAWIWERRAAEREGRLLSPRIYATGRSFTPEGGWGSRHGGTLKTAEDARRRALEYVERGTDGFKVVIEDGLGGSGTYEVIPDAMLETIGEVAGDAKVPVYVHAMNLEEYVKALEIDSRAIVHGLEDPIPEGHPLIERLLENDVAVVPTLSLWRSFLGYDQGPLGLDDPVLRASVPGFLLDRMKSPEFMAEENRRFREVARIEVYDWVREAIPIIEENTRKMHQAGVPLAVGTDAGGPVGFNFQGYNTPWELVLLVEAGLSPMEAIVAATGNGARVIGVSDRLGTLEPGKLADLLILDASPLEDIRNIRKIDRVVLGGKLFARSELSGLHPSGEPESAPGR